MSSVLYAREIKEQGRHIIDFMILEYDEKGSFQGRLDGKTAVLNNEYWIMKNIQITPKFGMAYFEKISKIPNKYKA